MCRRNKLTHAPAITQHLYIFYQAFLSNIKTLPRVVVLFFVLVAHDTCRTLKNRTAMREGSQQNDDDNIIMLSSRATDAELLITRKSNGTVLLVLSKNLSHLFFLPFSFTSSTITTYFYFSFPVLFFPHPRNRPIARV